MSTKWGAVSTLSRLKWRQFQATIWCESNMLFGWDNYNYNYNYNYKDDAVPMDVDSNALAHDHNYGKVSLSIELRKNVFCSLYGHNNEICFPKKGW